MNINKKASMEILGLLSVIFIAAVCCMILYNNLIIPKGLPANWDESLHMLYGLMIMHDLKDFSLNNLLWDSYHQFYWGFLHSWLVGIFFLFLGATNEAARMSSLFSFFLCIVLIYITGRELDEVKGWYRSGIASLFVGSSVFLYRSASECMIEVPALLMAIVVFLFLFRSFRKQSNLYYLVTGCLIALTFFMKINYGLLIFIALVVYGITEIIWSGNNVIESLKKILKDYILIFLPVIFLLFFWLIFPQIRVKSLLANLINRPQGPPVYSLQGILFYPKTLFELSGILTSVYILTWVISIKELKKNRAVRFLFIYSVVTILLLTFNQTKDLRHVYSLYPALFLFSAYQIEKLARRSNMFKAGLFLVLSIFFIYQFYSSALSEELRQISPYEAERSDAVRYVVDNIDSSKKIFILGGFNEMPPHLFNLEISKNADKKVNVYESHVLKRRLEKIDWMAIGEKNRVNRKGFIGVLSELNADYIVCLLIDKDSCFYTKDYLLWNKWKAKYVYLLENIPEYSLFARKYYSKIGLNLLIYKKKYRFSFIP